MRKGPWPLSRSGWLLKGRLSRRKTHLRLFQIATRNGSKQSTRPKPAAKLRNEIAALAIRRLVDHTTEVNHNAATHHKPGAC
jgi:hypothetical protein